MGVKISNFTLSNLTGSDKIPFVRDSAPSDNYIGSISSLSASLVPVNSLTASFVSASNVKGTVLSASYALSSSNSLSSSYALSSSNALSSSYLIYSNLFVNNITASNISASRIIASIFSTSGSKIGTPEMYGAVGDGVTDDQLAFKHALISHSIVKLDAKTYAIRGWLGMPSYRTLVGEGKDKSVIKLMNNSPYGYNISGQIYVIQNTMLSDTIPTSSIGWSGSSNWSANGNLNNISGNLNIDHRDTVVLDQATDSPFYQQSQAQDWNGIGYWSYDSSGNGLWGSRKDVVIENLTIDCNFDNQARHSSYNVANNPWSASNGGNTYYSSKYSFKVRPTVHAIVLSGENITIRNVRVKNFGYGTAYSTTTNFYDIVYNENFPILIGGPYLSYNTSSYNLDDNDKVSDAARDSTFKANNVIDSEVINIGSADLLTPHSNTTAIYLTNQSVNTSTGESTFSTAGEINNCLVDPGERLYPTTASLWSGSYLDQYVSSSLKNGSSTLADWLLGGGSLTGSNGDYAYSEGVSWNSGLAVWKKISGSWLPATTAYSNRFDHCVQAFSGYRLFDSVAKNCLIGFYLDSWRNNAFVENNDFINVGSGFRFVVSDISLTSSYKNAIVKNNYINLYPHDRYFLGGHSVIMYGVDRSTGTNSTLRHIDNLQIENNTFELPISGTRPVYNPQSYYYTYPRYVGLWYSSETNPSGSYDHLHRSLIIRNNHFENWNPYNNSTGEQFNAEIYGYNTPIYFSYTTSSIEFDTNDSSNGPFPNSLNKFNNQVLPQYIIEGNTYNSPIYPSTASLVPITYHMYGNNGYAYAVDQVNRFSNITAKNINITGTISVSGNISASNITASKLFLSYDAEDALISKGPLKVVVDASGENYVSQFTVNTAATNLGLSANQINGINYSYTPLILAATGSTGLNLSFAIGGTRRTGAPNNTQTISELGFHTFDSASYALSQSYIAGIGAFVQSTTVGDRNGNLGFYTVSASNSNSEVRQCRAIIDYEGRMGIGLDSMTERLVVRGNISSSGLIIPNSQSYADSISSGVQALRTGSMVLTGSKLYIYTGLGSTAPFGAGWQTASLG